MQIRDAVGAEPVLLARAELHDWMASRGWDSEPGHFLHPHTDEEVMAGHGTLGLELIEQVPDVERVLVPVGGGALVVGVASAVKARKPNVEVVGVQSDGYPLWPRSFEAGGRAELQANTIADGTTAPFNQEMFERLRECVDRWLLVPEPRLRTSIAEVAAVGKVVAEGAGALAYAAIEQLEPGRLTAVVISGGNIDQNLLRTLFAA
jgi:threonine dehydratase